MQEIRQHGCGRLYLRLAVVVGLNDLCVDAHRCVVHEHPAVDLRQVDHSHNAVAECVQRTNDVLAVDPEVQCEVIARTGRDDDEG